MEDGCSADSVYWQDEDLYLKQYFFIQKRFFNLRIIRNSLIFIRRTLKWKNSLWRNRDCPIRRIRLMKAWSMNLFTGLKTVCLLKGQATCAERTEIAEGIKEGCSKLFVMSLAFHSVYLSQVVPIGLIVSKFVSNAFKFAFPDNRSGVISVSLKKKRHRRP